MPCPAPAHAHVEQPILETVPEPDSLEPAPRGATDEWDALLEKLRRQLEHAEQVDHGWKAEADHFRVRACIDAAQTHLAEARLLMEEEDVDRVIRYLDFALAERPCRESVLYLLEHPDRPLDELLQHRDERVRACAFELVRAGYCYHRANERPSSCTTCPP